MTYRLLVSRLAQKDLADLPLEVAQRISERVARLADDPRPSGCKKLVAAVDLWRIRIGRYRAVYAIDDEQRTVRLEYVRHRKDAY